MKKDSMVKCTMVELFPTKREHCGNKWFLLVYGILFELVAGGSTDSVCTDICTGGYGTPKDLASKNAKV